MESFPIIVNGYKPLTTAAKLSMLDVYNYATNRFHNFDGIINSFMTEVSII